MHPPASPEYPAQAGPPAPSYPGEEERLSAAELDRSMELDGSSSTADSLALFRSYSMPIPLSAAGSDDEGPLDREAEEDGNEDDEDYDELLTTPTSQLQLHNPLPTRVVLPVRRPEAALMLAPALAHPPEKAAASTIPCTSCSSSPSPCARA
ncbi:hypothetical protein PTTG_28584 [Puccinia triticina 1-1 BBBD Race 1]|uniref:Uncharacterized protein n=1 Tax=Puccinia triticina (isolate 1-1 / race 1 (BBBD)) TaxID=630390 RepID=A0A180GAX9_PUCT1|nr:hypothetical protein PTTG_28584 [Puccinia triticina 1-1 BBBD Race 1]